MTTGAARGRGSIKFPTSNRCRAMEFQLCCAATSTRRRAACFTERLRATGTMRSPKAVGVWAKVIRPKCRCFASITCGCAACAQPTRTLQTRVNRIIVHLCAMSRSNKRHFCLFLGAGDLAAPKKTKNFLQKRLMDAPHLVETRFAHFYEMPTTPNQC